MLDEMTVKEDFRPAAGWRKVVYGFTPNWFSVTMGTGSVSLLLFELPFESAWLYWLSIAAFLLNVVLFSIFLVLTVLRYVLYPFLFRSMLQDLGQSLFIGTLPIAFSTIIAMTIQVGVPVLGQPLLTTVWVLWWIDMASSATCCITMPFLIVYSSKAKELRFMTTAWLLPMIPMIVSSATGAIVADALVEPNHAMWTLMASYALLGSGLSLALSISTVFLLRLMLHGFPVRENSAGMFLPLGPLGQGAFAVQRLGSVAKTLLSDTEIQGYAFVQAGDVLYIGGWLVALPLLGLALLWLAISLIHLLTRKFPFNMGWWAFTFPLGTVAMAMITLGNEMPSMFLTVLGTILTTSVVLLWLTCTLKTIHKAWSGELFEIH